ncbi:isoprenoid synthase domain-containing protein [Mycena galopus ATCC 62051]|nr:isoprenoid synthase domain-containing protein [Mycena galopus ATCC 62051]
MALQDFKTGSFQLPALAHALSSLELKSSPFYLKAKAKAHAWFESYNVYPPLECKAFLEYDFAYFSAFGYPETVTQSRLETCMEFILWVFAYDDIADESGLKHSQDGNQLAVDIILEILNNPDGPIPKFKYARMLQDIASRVKSTGSPGAYKRFIGGFEVFAQGSLWQTTNRISGRTPGVDEFIHRRRDAGAIGQLFSLIEYAMDIDIPDHLYNDPSVISIGEAAGDLAAWANDICSFNIEQSHGDSQNLVYCVFVERNCSLQDAMDHVADMFLQEKLSNSDSLVVQKYHKGYFDMIPATDGQTIELYPRKQEPPALSAADLENL